LKKKFYFAASIKKKYPLKLSSHSPGGSGGPDGPVRLPHVHRPHSEESPENEPSSVLNGRFQVFLISNNSTIPRPASSANTPPLYRVDGIEEV